MLGLEQDVIQIIPNVTGITIKHLAQNGKMIEKKLLSKCFFLWYRSSINEYFVDDINTAETVAHEIGHNLNMSHDFLEIQGPNNKDKRLCPTDDSTCTDVSGIMDYYETAPLSWSCCSRYDFTTWFNSYNVCILDNL